ncbi:hopanoid biosynthesis-associated protein HpnK [Paraburkholderia phymatum]|uniref:Hopanoid biosynthesis associated protein HpnK n=1 Tax=Paraburkholderia phymatum (strain DSM 17167 / CIP 108236 / LMG 21445 / STM815) TaxID=391038 RepID=B2JHC9_PARP8|nr:hopanoid biosynthesis-associated protein HpnK [Paraburkholderia phymatum]ACC70367.1 hopanoid biosynthesis associated protein HpnK [Paraburkholderia phymatum STM815]
MTQRATHTPRRALIVTADDFGLHPRINEAVERAHLHGILTSASLMVAAAASADAVHRARQYPSLRVGLHIVLADGVPMLATHLIPALVDGHGRLGDRMVRDGFRFFLLPEVRRQLKAEIRAQFQAFARTGLKLDHVNTHKHFHLHPTVLALIIEVGSEYGLNAMRLPYERGAPAWIRPWIARVRKQLDNAGIAHNDYIIGMSQTGHMDEAALLAALARLPEGVGEIYCHPAVPGEGPITPTMQTYRHSDEFDALMSERVAAALAASGAITGGFADVFAQRAYM